MKFESIKEQLIKEKGYADIKIENYVDYEGKRYYFDGEAFFDDNCNHINQYKAYAYTGETNEYGDLIEYAIRWNITDTWKEYERLHEEYCNEGNNSSDSEWLDYLNDQSNACDWDNPVSVEEV